MDRGDRPHNNNSSSSGGSGQDFSKENRNAQLLGSDGASMLAPHLRKDAEPWRGSSGGFELVNLLNRPSPAAAAAAPVPSHAPAAPLPKISLPSLHAFGKPFKPELPPAGGMLLPSAARGPSQRPASPPPRSLAIHTSDPAATTTSTPGERKPASREGDAPSPSEQTPPRKPSQSSGNSNSARRIAPAPAEDEEGEPDDELAGSIRGGRWTADEHERFLAGFRIHGHKWKRVQQVVRTRSVTQVRTHAQKYLLKVAKLKAEGKAAARADSSSDAEASGPHTAPSSPAPVAGASGKRSADESFDGGSPAARTPKKKARHQAAPPTQTQTQVAVSSDTAAGPRVDVLDQEYIAAAATTLCFLMTQKIDSLFDSRHELEKDLLEPYDCYAEAQSAAAAAQASVAAAAGDARKRPYMHFLTESPNPYQSESAAFAFSESERAEATGYAVEAKKLYS